MQRVASEIVLEARPGNVYWGYIDRDQPPAIEVPSSTIIAVEAITHHAGDAPDLLMDERVRAIWAAIAESDRGPGVHILTGPVAVAGAKPGDTLAVRVHTMTPRVPYGSNCAANWGLLYDDFGKERITIYELERGDAPGFPDLARPAFGFDFTARPTYDIPGVISVPDAGSRESFGRPVRVPVRPHFGVMGVAPAEPGRHSSIPPGVFGGNVDNWRLGPGAVMRYPVFTEGAMLYVGDPHFAQGDGEICGTAIEASLDARIEVWIERDEPITAPLLETDTHWYTHGFGDTLDEACRMAAREALDLLVVRYGLTRDEAYSLASVALDLGVTQVVDGKVGCHAGIAKAIFT